MCMYKNDSCEDCPDKEECKEFYEKTTKELKEKGIKDMEMF